MRGRENAGRAAEKPRAKDDWPGGLFRYELRRGFGGVGFRLGLLGGMAVVLGHLFGSLLPLTRYQDAWQKNVFLTPHSAWLHWIGLDSATPWPTLLTLLLPLLAALPAAASASWDRETSYLCQLRLRCTARQYRLARLAGVFCTAFAVTVLPLLTDLALSTALLPVIRPEPAGGLCPIRDADLLGGWFYRCPLGYILGYTLFDGLFVAAWVCLALPAGRLLRGRGQAALAPFALFLLVWFAGLWSGWMGQTPMSILLPFQPLTGLRAGAALGWPGGVLLLTAAGWLAGGRRCDAL